MSSENLLDVLASVEHERDELQERLRTVRALVDELMQNVCHVLTDVDSIVQRLNEDNDEPRVEHKKNVQWRPAHADKKRQER